MPPGAWTWRQSWQDLLFAHWPISAAQLRPLVPKELRIQELGGTSGDPLLHFARRIDVVVWNAEQIET